MTQITNESLWCEYMAYLELDSITTDLSDNKDDISKLIESTSLFSKCGHYWKSYYHRNYETFYCGN